MVQQQSQKKNGHRDDDVKKIAHELGLQEEILRSSGSNPLLEETNLGLGKYDDDYKWQQVRSYRKGLYAFIAFGRSLEKREIYETKIKLGEEGFNPTFSADTAEVQVWPKLDESEVPGNRSTWNVARERGTKIWQRLGEAGEIITPEQIAAVSRKTSITEDWKPLFWELVAGRHEVSRSEDAELLRDSLNGIKELRQHDSDEGGLLG